MDNKRGTIPEPKLWPCSRWLVGSQQAHGSIYPPTRFPPTFPLHYKNGERREAQSYREGVSGMSRARRLGKLGRVLILHMPQGDIPFWPQATDVERNGVLVSAKEWGLDDACGYGCALWEVSSRVLLRCA